MLLLLHSINVNKKWLIKASARRAAVLTLEMMVNFGLLGISHTYGAIKKC